MNSELTLQKLTDHYGHGVVIARYGSEAEAWNYALECETCNEVLADADTEVTS